ncbi:MAG: inosine/xanthosine triphosphatase [Bacteroidota bacterium]
MKKIIVASRNPVKIQAALGGFQKMFPNESWSVEGLAVPSGVADQPMDDAETLRGAQQRVINVKKAAPQAAFWVGIEGGLEPTPNGMLAMAWIVIHSAQQQGQARTGAFPLPAEVIQHIKAGKELGVADDLVFGQSNSKHNSGAVGLLTNHLMDRTQLYTEGVVLALIPFQNPQLYPPAGSTAF